jgi:hypothetical protein
MRGIYASGIIAAMENIETLRDRSEVDFPRCAMRQAYGVAGPADNTVTTVVATGRPFPALVKPAPVYLGRKPFSQWPHLWAFHAAACTP